MSIPVIQSRSEQKEPSNTTSSTITAPTGITDGDVLIICMATDGNATSINWPSGFTPIAEVHGPSNRCTAAAAYKIASGESGNYAVSWTGNEQAILEMYRVDGAISGDEVQDPDESNTGTSSTATITPVAATDADDSLVFVVSGTDDDDITVDGGGDADYTVEDVDKSSAGANTCAIGVQSKGIATAAVPPQCDLSLTASEEFAAFWFAVRSIAPGGASGSGAQALPSLSQAGVGEQPHEGTVAQTLPSSTQAGVGVLVPSGTGAQALSATTQAGVGEQKLPGSGVQTLPATTQAGVGVMQPSGTGAQTLPATTQAGAGAQTLIGSAAQTLPATTQSGVGVMQPSGAGAQALPATTQAGVGEVPVEGSSAQALPATTQAGAGEVPVEGSGAQALAAATQAGVGVMQPSGTGAQTLPATTQAGAGEQKLIGSAVQTLPATTQAAAGEQPHEGTGAQALPATTQAGAGVQTHEGSGASALPAATQAGTGVHTSTATGSGAQTFAAVTQAGAAEQRLVGTAAQLIPALAQSADSIVLPSGSAAQTLAALVQAAVGAAVVVATARREVVLAALKSALGAITSVSGLVVERNRRGWIDGDRDLAAGPRLVMHDGDQEVIEELREHKLYRATPLIEGFARGATAAAASPDLEALYNAAVEAIEGDAGLQSAAFMVRPGEMEPGLDAEAGHRAVVGFGFTTELDYHATPADPYSAPV